MKSTLNKLINVFIAFITQKHLKGILFILVFLAFVLSSKGQFVPEKFSSKVSGEKLKTILSAGIMPINIDTVSDDKFPQMVSGSAWRTSYKHKSVSNRITISVKDTTKKMQKFDYVFGFKVYSFNSSNQKDSFDISVRLSFDPRTHKSYIDKSVYQFQLSHKFILKLTSVVDSALSVPTSFSASSMQTNFSIESEIIVERYYLESYDTTVTSLSHNFIGKDKLRISWSPPTSSGPNVYELEWAYIDTAGIKSDSLKYDFKMNSSRVQIAQTYYDLNTIYDAGVLLYRVRRVKPDSVYYLYPKYSKWYPSNFPNKGYVKNYTSNKVYLSSHESMVKNWDYQISFAEKGLKKEIVNYFDGSLKRRQGVTLSNTNNFTLVDESIYDHFGRESIKVIPTPTDSSTLKFYKYFNVNVSGDPYSANDFDVSDSMVDRCNGEYTAQPLGTQNGAGRYYSTSNPDKTGSNAAIPDAGGFPLVQTLLMPDPTGRVASQGGIGNAHQIGSGHDTKYSYGTSGQNEVDELFGSEVGIANHYKKNSIIDPNGQVSISYIDQHGRVVATSLSGGVPGMMDTLGNYKSPVFVNQNIGELNKLIKNSLMVQYGFKVLNSGVQKIYYKLETPDFYFGCLGLNKCISCKYDLTLQLNDNCGNKLLSFTSPIGSLNDTSCSNLNFNLSDSISNVLGSVSLIGDTLSFTLNPGDYNLMKILTVNSDGLEERIYEVFNNDTSCVKTISEFIDEEIEKIDFSDCYCDTCDTDTFSYCDARKQLMLEDMAPGGQYALYDEIDFTVSDSTSILRNYGDGYYFQYLNGNYYKDENGKKDTIWVSGSPIIPNELGIEDFVSKYRESWGNSMLSLHPEYCYYRYCVDSLHGSLIFDDEMMEVENYDTAAYYGYINPLGHKKEYVKNITDPFFVKNGVLNAKGREMVNRLKNLDPYTIGTSQDPLLVGATYTDLWQLSKSIGYCESISDSIEREACFKSRYSDSTVINNWMKDEFGDDNYWDKFKTIYFQIKQKYIEELMNTYVTGSSCVKNIGFGCSNSRYTNKTSHFVRYNNLDTNIIKPLFKASLEDSLVSYSNSSCDVYVPEWERAISNCENYSTHKDSIIYHFKQICKQGYSNKQSLSVFGLNQLPDSLSSNLTFRSFDAVLKHFIGNDYRNSWCSVDLINMPKTITSNVENNNYIEANDCICENIKTEVKLYKGCYNINDSQELSVEGQLVNKFINLMVDNNLFAINDTNTRSLNSYSGMTNIINKLFIPLIGGTASQIKFKVRSTPTYSNEKTYNIYFGNVSNGCSFSFRLDPNTADFASFDTTYSYLIKPRADGSIDYRFKRTGGATVIAHIYSTCFNNLLKCSENLSYTELESFKAYIDNKYDYNLSVTDLEKLIAECGNGGTQNKVIDKKNTYYLRYGSCPEEYRNYKEPKNTYLLSFLNEMMRPNEYWRPGMPGYVSADKAKRYLNTSEKGFHCISGARDFLTQTKDYRNYKNTVGVNIATDNYWWVDKKYTIDSSFSALGSGKVYDTIWVNNYNNDLDFVGGFWIGSKCDVSGDSSCFYSFGDPKKHLGVGSRPTIAQIDSLTNYRWDNTYNNYVITAFNRASGDSVILTFTSTCAAQCSPLYKPEEIAINYKDVFILPGRGGLSKIKNVTAETYRNNVYAYPFLDLINGLAKSGNLTGGSNIDIRRIQKTKLINNYFDALIPITSGYNYSNVLSNNNSMIGKLGIQNSSDTQFCQFGLVKKGNSWNFSSIDVFKNLKPDPQAIEDGMRNDRVDMAGYYFTIEAGNINSPGDTSWYTIKGWSSCWKFFEISTISGNSKNMYELPEGLISNCSCKGCEESIVMYDSLVANYPDLHPRHPNYEIIVTNYVNKLMNSSMTFAEIQSNWEACGVGKFKFVKLPEFDYRLSVKNTNCISYADTMLNLVLDDFNLGNSYKKIKDSDSSYYLLDFYGLNAIERSRLKDSLQKYFNSPYCNAFKHWSNYRLNYDITIYNLDSVYSTTIGGLSGYDDWFDEVKTNLFGNSSNLVKLDVDNINYSEDNFYTLDNWYSKIRFNQLDANKREQFLDTLQHWLSLQGDFEIKRHFYSNEISSTYSDICFYDEDTVCLSCDSIRDAITSYQFGINTDSTSYSLAMKPEYVQKYLRSSFDKNITVYEDVSSCLSCSNSSLYVCNEPDTRIVSFINLLNKIAKAKKLNSSNYYLNSSYNTLLNQLKPNGITLNAPSYTKKANLIGGWNVTIRYNALNSDVFILSSDTNDYFNKFNSGIDTFKQLRPLFEGGNVTGFSVDAMDSLYQNFTFNVVANTINPFSCCEMPVTMLCPKPMVREYSNFDGPCKEDEIAQAINEGTFKYYSYLDSLKSDLKLKYQVHCLAYSEENFTLGHYKQRYHSTLYYYDQAGNLVKTVPPQGVKDVTLNTNKKDSIETYRKDIIQSQKFVNTYHTLSTVYRYNALNQLVWQKTPDGGESQFWYDRLGRLVLSQNAVQYAKSGVSQKIYSYTIYDELGRINEVGEISNRAVNNDSLIGTLAYFDNWLNGSTARSQITKTYYDYPITQKIYTQFVNTGQRNLRGRVSSICYYNAYTSNDTANYTRATHYSYDIHGNVDHLIHDFPEMEQLGHRFKHLLYDYDLISGKVHSVAYQPGQTDRWFHRYDYDADNRIVLAETSLDSVIWDKDAEYEYYKHGPLSRVILGEHGVQGVDYAYTIHGWIKGVNSASLVAGRDVGKDGYGNLRKYTARDAYGYTLGYYNDNTGGAFDGDYKSIGTTSFEVNKTGSPIASANKNLYNGNISHMVSNVSVLMPLNNNSPLATVYRYDQLNRIKSVRTFNSINLDSNKWSSGSLSNSWNESFDFDANGNITKLQRNGVTNVMDQLTYNYKSGTNQLRSVDDTVSNSVYTTDIDDQDLGNYRYDKIGNLTYDDKEEIDSIHWNVYGKISKIVRKVGSKKPSLEFEYDAMGQRVLKVVKKGPIEKDWDYTWYVRDAQGNIMATYNKKNILKNGGDTSIYRKINNSIVSQYNTDSLAEFIKYFYKGTQVYSSIGGELISRELLDDYLETYHADSILYYDSAYASDVLKYFCDYVSSSTDRRDLLLQMLINKKDSIIEMIGKGCFNMNDLIARVLTYDGASDELLNALATLDISRFDLIYQSLGAPPPPPIPTLAQKITFIRSNSNLSISNSINNQFNVSELETIIKSMTSSIIDSVIMNLELCELNTNITNCSFDFTWFNFVVNSIDNNVVKSIILGTSEPNYLSNLLIDKDRYSVNKIASLEKDIIADVLRNETSVDLMVYLSYIYKRFGRTVFNQIIDDLDGDLTLNKNITLNELHIYGSSRHGIAKPDKLLASKTYEITEITEEGGFGSVGYANDSIVGQLEYAYFKRTLTKKQYELTNHLGNVLATILDRKTAVTDSLGGDTLKFYQSDVSTAQYYYAFGSCIQELQYAYSDAGDTSKYRFGFQNQEIDNELKGNGNTINFTFRVYDTRVGKFLSIDPLSGEYPFYSPYQFSGNRVIDMIELEGLEPAESGSYGGQGAIASEIKNGKTVEGTENQRWTWNNGAWGKVDFNVTNSELIGIFDKGKADALKQIEITVNLQGSTYGIKSKQSLAHFISQAGHEVGGFTKGLGIEENLNYSVSGLIGTFGKYFYKGTAIVGKYDASLYGFIKDEKGKITQTANKEGIANIVYANRMGNGDFASGDGYKYRGRGIFQLTGKSNYKEFNTFLSQVGVDIVANPDLLITNEYSIKSAMWYYKTKVVDKLDIENTTVESVTKRVNGGTNGLAERKTIYNKAIEKLK